MRCAAESRNRRHIGSLLARLGASRASQERVPKDAPFHSSRFPAGERSACRTGLLHSCNLKRSDGENPLLAYA